MEFTVSKADLVRELNLSQGVVEKKTTIPILSNVLLEAAGDRVVITATDLEGPLKGKPLSGLMKEIRTGNAYIKILTKQHPGGELRGGITRRPT
jgi:hypothetical protein